MLHQYFPQRARHACFGGRAVMVGTVPVGTVTAYRGERVIVEAWLPRECHAGRFDINAMLGEIAGQAVADANIAETAKVQKGIIIDTHTGANGREAKPDWRPRWAAFPFGTYRSGARLRPAVVWKKVSSLFKHAA